MENWIISVTMIIGGAIITGLLIWFVILFTKQEEIRENRDLAINLADTENGVSIGPVVKIEEKPNDTVLMTMLPGDLSPKTIKAKKGKIEPVSFLVSKSKIDTTASGKWSREKNVHWLMPQTAKELPKEILNSFIGKALAFSIEYVNTDDVVKKAMSEGWKRASSYLVEMGHGEFSIARMEQVIGLFKDLDSLYKEPKKEKSSSLTPGV